MTDAEIAALRHSCHTMIAGHRQPSAAQDFAAMAQWCEANDVVHDTYGDGELIQAFEKKVAALLGFEAGVFCITGTLTQVTALRLACIARGSELVALHPTAHILLHERSNYQLLNHFKALQLGDPYRPWTLDDLTAFPEKLAATLIELPMREIGGQLPGWDQLDAIKRHCAGQGIHLHMDGARLWEAQAGFGRSLQEIAAGFDSAYVSFYKGIGGLGGAMLLGQRDFIAQAQSWMKSQGGNVFRRSPYVVAAAMQFEQRLAAMPAYFQRTLELYQVLREYPQWQPNPSAPHSNMLHLHLPVSRERATEIRNRIAQQHGVWLFGRASHAALPDRSYIEWYVGDNLMAIPDLRLREILDRFATALDA